MRDMLFRLLVIALLAKGSHGSSADSAASACTDYVTEVDCDGDNSCDWSQQLCSNSNSNPSPTPNPTQGLGMCAGTTSESACDSLKNCKWDGATSCAELSCSARGSVDEATCKHLKNSDDDAIDECVWNPEVDDKCVYKCGQQTTASNCMAKNPTEGCFWDAYKENCYHGCASGGTDGNLVCRMCARTECVEEKDSSSGAVTGIKCGNTDANKVAVKAAVTAYTAAEACMGSSTQSRTSACTTKRNSAKTLYNSKILSGSSEQKKKNQQNFLAVRLCRTFTELRAGIAVASPESMPLAGHDTGGSKSKGDCQSVVPYQFTAAPTNPGCGTTSTIPVHQVALNGSDISCATDGVVGIGGGALCPAGKFPTGHKIGNTHWTANSGQDFGKVVCQTPSATEVTASCLPTSAAERVVSYGTTSTGFSSLPLPQSCTAIGTATTHVVIDGYKWTIHCKLWKHAFCIHSTGQRPEENEDNPCPALNQMCASTKNVEMVHATVCDKDDTSKCHKTGGGAIIPLKKCSDGFSTACKSDGKKDTSSWAQGWTVTSNTADSGTAQDAFEVVMKATPPCAEIAILR